MAGSSKCPAGLSWRERPMDALRHALKVLSLVPEYPAGQSGSAQAVHAAACKLGKLGSRMTCRGAMAVSRGSMRGRCEALPTAPEMRMRPFQEPTKPGSLLSRLQPKCSQSGSASSTPTRQLNEGGWPQRRGSRVLPCTVQQRGSNQAGGIGPQGWHEDGAPHHVQGCASHAAQLAQVLQGESGQVPSAGVGPASWRAAVRWP